MQIKINGNHIITSKIEHHAILESCEVLAKKGFEITYLDVDEEGFVNLEQLENSINDKTILISIMFANNEIGTIEPIRQISEIARRHNIIFHTDAVQAIGNVPIDVKDMEIDMMSISGHKIYAPKGVGALYVKKGIKFEKFMSGGHQEKDKRGGTENLASIVGLGKAAELAKTNLNEHIKQLKELRDYFVKQIKEKIGTENIKINGSENFRLPGNSNISFKGIDGMALLLELDRKGICASSGSACTSGDPKPSHVLTAIKVPDEYIHGALRITMGEFNRKWEVDFLVENLKNILYNLEQIK